MRRWLVLLFALWLPLQFGWSAASAYCQHETGEQQSAHVGHHVHVHQGETPSSDSALGADADCASCHANAAVVMPTTLDGRGSAFPAAMGEAATAPPFTSALARAPDRPQWPRLV